MLSNMFENTVNCWQLDHSIKAALPLFFLPFCNTRIYSYKQMCVLGSTAWQENKFHNFQHTPWNLWTTLKLIHFFDNFTSYDKVSIYTVLHFLASRISFVIKWYNYMICSMENESEAWKWKRLGQWIDGRVQGSGMWGRERVMRVYTNA